MAAEELIPARSLKHTPTWALATLCFFMVSISIILEHSLHLLTKWLKKRRKVALCGAVDRLKSELMLLGFLSLLLAITQDRISKICIPGKLADTMLPCRKEISTSQSEDLYEHMRINVGLVHSNSIISANDPYESNIYRRLADDDDDENVVNNTSIADPCTAKGKVSLVTQNGIQQLQRFIFVLAVTHIVYSVLTMALGRAKMRRWNGWEKETQTTEYSVVNADAIFPSFSTLSIYRVFTSVSCFATLIALDLTCMFFVLSQYPNRFRFTKQTTFGRRHVTTCTETSLLLWIKCFFRQFFNSVARVDYLTLRHGFISAHHLSGRYGNFNFRKYIERSLDEDFKIVVSISPIMWFIVVIFMVVEVYGWHAYLWMAFVPLLIVLVTGTKLEVIVARMGLRVQNHNIVTKGTPLVQPSDDLFWFSRPRFVLRLLHAALFVNAFELAFFIWVVIEFGMDSCYHEHMAIIVTRVVLAVAVQVLCSYITLPLYALVTQMGSDFRSKALDNQEIESILKRWVAEVRNKRKEEEQNSFQSLSADCSLRNSPTPPMEYSSHHHHSPPINQTSNHGEITEEEIVEELVTQQ